MLRRAEREGEEAEAAAGEEAEPQVEAEAEEEAEEEEEGKEEDEAEGGGEIEGEGAGGAGRWVSASEEADESLERELRSAGADPAGGAAAAQSLGAEEGCSPADTDWGDGPPAGGAAGGAAAGGVDAEVVTLPQIAISD